MASAKADFRLLSRNVTHRRSAAGPFILPRVEVVRKGRVEPFLHAHPTLSSAAVGWSGITLEDYSIPACVIARHSHVENFLHVVLRGVVKYEVLTCGRARQFRANSGTTFILPRGTVDEVIWEGSTNRTAAVIHASLLISALDETAHESDIELTEHWNLTDPHILAVLLALRTDLNEGSPSGRLYGESLATALAVYLLTRYAVRRYKPALYRGGLPGYRLKRVLDYIGDNLADDLSLSQLAAVAGMSPHYFTELFGKSTGHAPHRYVLLKRIERAKLNLCDPVRSVIDAGLDAGFQNPSHFARVFRKFVGTSPSQFQSEMRPSRRPR